MLTVTRMSGGKMSQLPSKYCPIFSVFQIMNNTFFENVHIYNSPASYQHTQCCGVQAQPGIKALMPHKGTGSGEERTDTIWLVLMHNLMIRFYSTICEGFAEIQMYCAVFRSVTHGGSVTSLKMLVRELLGTATTL